MNPFMIGGVSLFLLSHGFYMRYVYHVPSLPRLYYNYVTKLLPITLLLFTLVSLPVI